jgi:hypothetical protein
VNDGSEIYVRVTDITIVAKDVKHLASREWRGSLPRAVA